MEIPCTKDCGGRNADCHSYCESYKKWKAYKENQKLEKTKRENIEQYYISNSAKYKTKKLKSKK